MYIVIEREKKQKKKQEKSRESSQIVNGAPHRTLLLLAVLRECF